MLLLARDIDGSIDGRVGIGPGCLVYNARSLTRSQIDSFHPLDQQWPVYRIPYIEVCHDIRVGINQLVSSSLFTHGLYVLYALSYVACLLPMLQPSCVRILRVLFPSSRFANAYF